MVHINIKKLTPKSCAIAFYKKFLIAVLLFSYGWCGTMGDYSTFPNEETKIESDNGWGFCEKSCYPDMDVSLGGIAREKVGLS